MEKDLLENPSRVNSFDSNFIDLFFKNKKLNYYFDDEVQEGTRQPITSNFNYNDRIKVLSYGSIITNDDIKTLSIGLPDIFTLREFITDIHDQKEEDIGVSCAISTAISTRTNYINYQRYRLTRFFFGNKFTPIKPSVLYIHWNANVQNVNKNNTKLISPSIASHLLSIESHKIVDASKYVDDVDKLNKEPDLLAFYHASKSQSLEWFKIQPSELTFKLLLNKGYPIICSIVVYRQMLSLISYQFGQIEPPSTGELSVGAHPILLIGYDNNKRKFIFANSWGKNWGDDGCGTIDFDYILSSQLAGDFYYITYKDW